MPITVLVADDAEIVRRAIRSLLMLYPAIQIVGEAGNFAQTIQMAKDLKPQVIVMDLHMSREGHGLDHDLQSCLSDGSTLLAISISNDEKAEEFARSLGAVKLLDKMNLYNELIPAIIHLASSANAQAETAD